ncbi:CG32437 [Drosophila busckii]|uniref:CG32437 n=2 Tax=Drosophila busckii TaxID=30019 RepID=A0A0M3QWI5_DROBS|nr:CG32437 [Drosophila busckii]
MTLSSAASKDQQRRHGRAMFEKDVIEGMSDWCTQCNALTFFIKSINPDKSGQLQYLEEPKESRGRSKQRQAASRKRHDVVEEELVHNKLQQALMDSMPVRMPFGSHLDAQMRSTSEQRSQRRQTETAAASGRSQSMAREWPMESRAGMQLQQTARKDMRLLNSEPRKRVRLDEQAKYDDSLLSNRLDEPESEEDDLPTPTPSNSSKRSYLTSPDVFTATEIQRLEAINPWQQLLQQRTNQLLDKMPETKRRRHVKRQLSETDSQHSLNRQQLNKAAQQQRRLNKELKAELAQRQHLLQKWESIRRRVEAECKLAKTELQQMQQCQMSHKQLRKERQRGGAHYALQAAHAPEQAQAKQVKQVEQTLDDRLELVLEALQEQTLASKSKLSHKSFEPSAPTPSVMQLPAQLGARPPLPEAEAASKQRTTSQPKCKLYKSIVSFKPKRMPSKLNLLVSTVQRARLRGFAEDPQELLESNQLRIKREPPVEQFTTLPCPHQELHNLMQHKQQLLVPLSEAQILVSRTPFLCPESDCSRLMFVSDFNRHLTCEHHKLTMERMHVNEVKTFFLDTRLTQLNRPKCCMVFFIKDKYLDVAGDNDPTLLPVLVMTTRLRLTEMFAPNFKPYSDCNLDGNEIFLIWLTSIQPIDCSLMGTIAVWPTSSKPRPEYLTVHTQEVYNIRTEPSLLDLYHSNRVLALPSSHIGRMTDKGQNLLAVQVKIH